MLADIRLQRGSGPLGPGDARLHAHQIRQRSRKLTSISSAAADQSPPPWVRFFDVHGRFLPYLGAGRHTYSSSGQGLGDNLSPVKMFCSSRSIAVVFVWLDCTESRGFRYAVFGFVEKMREEERFRSPG